MIQAIGIRLAGSWNSVTFTKSCDCTCKKGNNFLDNYSSQGHEMQTVQRCRVYYSETWKSSSVNVDISFIILSFKPSHNIWLWYPCMISTWMAFSNNKSKVYEPYDVLARFPLMVPHLEITSALRGTMHRRTFAFYRLMVGGHALVLATILFVTKFSHVALRARLMAFSSEWEFLLRDYKWELWYTIQKKSAGYKEWTGLLPSYYDLLNHERINYRMPHLRWSPQLAGPRIDYI